ncbi:neutral/alkaline non-lysosomal ceramidase N-terminal domain-containing protein [Candidatus Woesearchaeota archaeon]|nr:neutral/alkaline non-lysosomal ceramidase N-terminal domain-containing protein [Candidatus Woesearchaeota archaeon]
MNLKKIFLTGVLAALTLNIGCTAKKAQIMLEATPKVEYARNNLEGKLFVGVDKEDITPQAETTPLSGYGDRLESFWHGLKKARLPKQKMSMGVHDEVYARTIIASNGYKKVAIVNTDLLLINRELKEAVEKKVAFLKIDDILLCATHTHSSIGGYWENWGWEFGTGKYSQKTFDELVKKISTSIIEANQKMEPANIASTTTQIENLSANREVKNGIIDPQIGIIRITNNEGKVKAYLVNFAAHATSLSEKNFLISGDYPGVLETILEEEAEVALFTSGAAGNQRPRCPEPYNKGDPFAKPTKMGGLLAEKVLEATKNMKTEDYVVINSITKKIPLLPKNMRPIPVVGFFVKQYVRKDTYIQVIEIGNNLLMAVPGELGVELGLDLKNETKNLYTPFVITLANDHIGYILNEESYKRKRYEYRLSFYGPQSGLYMERQIMGLVNSLGKGLK